MDQRTRKLITMHEALHSRRWQTIFIKKGAERGLASTENSVNASIQRFEDYIEKHERGPITATRNDTDNTKIHGMTITRKQKWEEKQLYGCFKRLISNISYEKTWILQTKGNLKRETESLQIAAQKTP